MQCNKWGWAWFEYYNNNGTHNDTQCDNNNMCMWINADQSCSYTNTVQNCTNNSCESYYQCQNHTWNGTCSAW